MTIEESNMTLSKLNQMQKDQLEIYIDEFCDNIKGNYESVFIMLVPEDSFFDKTTISFNGEFIISNHYGCRLEEAMTNSVNTDFHIELEEYLRKDLYLEFKVTPYLIALQKQPYDDGNWKPKSTLVDTVLLKGLELKNSLNKIPSFALNFMIF